MYKVLHKQMPETPKLGLTYMTEGIMQASKGEEQQIDIHTYDTYKPFEQLACCDSPISVLSLYIP